MSLLAEIEAKPWPGRHYAANLRRHFMNLEGFKKSETPKISYTPKTLCPKPKEKPSSIALAYLPYSGTFRWWQTLAPEEKENWLVEHGLKEPEEPTLYRDCLFLSTNDNIGTMHECLVDVCERTGYTEQEIKGHSRRKNLCDARQELMYLCREIKDVQGDPKFSYPQIAKFLGGRDHSTVVHGIQAYKKKKGIK